MKKLEELQQDGITSVDLEELIGSEVLRQNNERLQKLIEYGKEGKLVPVIGSGLSSDYRIPTWNKLTSALFPVGFQFGDGKSIYKPYIEAFSQIPNHEVIQTIVKNGIVNKDNGKVIKPPTCNDPLEYAEYIRLALEEKAKKGPMVMTKAEIEKNLDPAFREVVQRALISNWQTTGKPKTKEDILKEDIKPFVESETTALSHIAKFVSKRKLDVITYNFDNILEMLMEELAKTDSTISWHSISSSEQMREHWNNDDINIYHVHGKIELGKDVDGANDGQLIFAEKQYYDAEHYLYEWIHAIQAEQIHKKHMMFIGFSGQDYNFKRIFKNLDVEKNKPTDNKHYIFLPLEDFISDIRIGEDISNPENVIKGIINVTMYMKELYLNSHGLYPIWICYEKLDKYMEEMERGILA